MENPKQEIHSVIKLVSCSKSPDIQKAALKKYFTSEAGLRHPFFTVKPGPLSRESILGVFQWYRTLSPRLEVDTKSVVYDKPNDVLLVDVELLFGIRFSPFKPAPCRMLSRFVLKQELGLHYIAMEEDFFQPDDLVTLMFPPLVPAIRMMLSAGTVLSTLLAKSAQVLGIWRAATWRRSS
ncbi:hypothetical protein B0H34DRAFT_810265 [Crassisporium funariophilum]|nr:hypothetical protein B0H34DRAFT_810265 [Crassisporium funariophilum]